MRLTEYEIKSIKKAFHEIFIDGKVILFGSRTDDTKRGGDIDLYLIPTKKFDDERKRKISFLVKLDYYIGEQKIDVIMAKDKNRLIEQEAIKNGVELMDTRELIIQKYINECKKHTIRINEAFDEIKYIFPISGKKYLDLKSDEVKNIDQYLFRFSKMQDTIGEKLFRLIVEDFIEQIDSMAFIDILNRLEKIGIIDSVNEWKTLKKVRNNISHQYDDNENDMAEAINNIFAQKDILLSIFNNIEQYFLKKV
jgi:hypothetical protein